ncbi:MAG: outer membrane beta-barrel protein [Bacteriovoracaceae bacterium]
MFYRLRFNLSLVLFRIFSVLLLSNLVIQSAQASTCAQIEEIKGETCENIAVKLDFSSCPKNERKTQTSINCQPNKAIVTGKNDHYEYKLELVQSDGAWGKKEWKAEGAIKRVGLRHKKTLLEKVNEDPAKPSLNDSYDAPVILQENSSNKSEFIIGGYFDGYYSYNFNKPDSNLSAESTMGNQLHTQQTQDRYYDRYTDQFLINLMQINFQKKTDEISMYAGIDFGQVADLNDPGDEIGKHLGLGYISYTPKKNDRFRFSMGKMATIIGIELYRSQDNWNYSRTTYYGLGIPFWYTGAEAEYKVIPDALTVKLVTANNWGPVVTVPASSYDSNKSKIYGFAANYVGFKNLNLNYSVLSGPEFLPHPGNSTYVSLKTRTIQNINAIYEFNEKISLAFDAIYAHQDARHYEGASLMAKYSINEDWWVSPRYEYFNDSQALAGAGSPAAVLPTSAMCASAVGSPCQTQNNFTFTNTFNLSEGLEFRTEYRRDHSNQAYFMKRSNAGNLSKTQENVTFAILYKF